MRGSGSAAQRGAGAPRAGLIGAGIRADLEARGWVFAFEAFAPPADPAAAKAEAEAVAVRLRDAGAGVVVVLEGTRDGAAGWMVLTPPPGPPPWGALAGGAADPNRKGDRHG